MKRVCLLLAAGVVLLGGSAVRAGEAVVIPGTLNLAAPPPAEPGCAGLACGGSCHGRPSRSCLDWLLYKPPTCHGACCCVVSTCWPPIYTHFLDMCQGCGRGGCGHAPASPCAGGGCGAPAPAPVVAPPQP